jgi:signal transduction histidine kinase
MSLKMARGLRAILHVSAIVLAGAVALYVANTLPFLDRIPEDSLRKQPWVFGVYVLLCLFMWAWIVLVGGLLERSRLGLWQKALIGAFVFPAATGAALFFAILPLFHLCTGVIWVNPWPLWIVNGAYGAALQMSRLMQLADDARRRQTLRLLTDNQVLEIAMDRAKLSILEAQIEPHFLFNTLAHIKHQYSVDAAGGDRMLDMLTVYLDRALPGLERDDWTVEDEFDLIGIYLEIMVLRFGEQLSYAVQAAPECRPVRLPPLTVITLVENAIRHGLAPKREAGFVEVKAAMTDGALSLEVNDNGVGFKKVKGSGLGLDTIRARLIHAYGADAALIVEPGANEGVRARVRLPLSETSAEEAEPRWRKAS